jgi:hypothetical protein
MIATPDVPFGIRCTDATAGVRCACRRTFSARLLTGGIGAGFLRLVVLRSFVLAE